MYWNLIWKSPGFVPFGANLTHFGAKPTIPALEANKYQFKWELRLDWKKANLNANLMDDVAEHTGRLKFYLNVEIMGYLNRDYSSQEFNKILKLSDTTIYHSIGTKSYQTQYHRTRVWNGMWNTQNWITMLEIWDGLTSLRFDQEMKNGWIRTHFLHNTITSSPFWLNRLLCFT